MQYGLLHLMFMRECCGGSRMPISMCARSREHTKYSIILCSMEGGTLNELGVFHFPLLAHSHPIFAASAGSNSNEKKNRENNMEKYQFSVS